MNLTEIEENVELVDTDQGFGMIYDLLRAYGIPKASISRLRSGNLDKSDHDNETLWKGKVFFRYVQTGEADLHALIDATESDQRIVKNKPRFVIVRDDEQMLALDTKTRDTLDIKLNQLPKHATFFLPWAGIEKTTIENANIADVKAAEKMARLYDEIIKHNQIETVESVHSLNVFFSRLLFCFFAEDTEVFRLGQFTNAVASYTQQTGADVGGFLDELFDVLNTAPKERGNLPGHFRTFGYVNGKLFDQSAPSPTFSAKARRIVLECGEFDWAQINPDIFGSMIQAVVHPGERESLGIHYTSVENIMKVLRPLFLDDLKEEYEKAIGNVRKLEKLLARLARIRILDPACGSGNFLVIAYKELRAIEHRALARLHEAATGQSTVAVPQQLFPEPRVRLENFYGIEIDDFAHEIALLSLWLAKHQMNLEYRKLFDVLLPLIPLTDSGHVVCGNAGRVDWPDVMARTKDSDELYLVGNPPYLGGTRQTQGHKEDLATAFSDANVHKYLDYVSIWLIKGAAYVESQQAEVGFVVTNSVCQGNHVDLLWPKMAEYEVEISFAHEPFLWTNYARNNAGVTCIIIGLAPFGRYPTKSWYEAGSRRDVKSINAYLVPDGPDIIVAKASSPLNGLPPMVFGSMPRDGGGLDSVGRGAQVNGGRVSCCRAVHLALCGGGRFSQWQGEVLPLDQRRGGRSGSRSP